MDHVTSYMFDMVESLKRSCPIDIIDYLPPSRWLLFILARNHVGVMHFDKISREQIEAPQSISIPSRLGWRGVVEPAVNERSQHKRVHDVCMLNESGSAEVADAGRGERRGVRRGVAIIEAYDKPAPHPSMEASIVATQSR